MTFKPVYFLIVDDLEQNLTALEALLRKDGLVILKAKSGTEALELLLSHDVALAFIDVQMPDMDGFELAEFMRGTERTKGVPIIFLTAGTSDTQRRFRGYEAGAVDFLQKPVETNIIKSKADVFFELHRRRQELSSQKDALELATQESERYAAALEEADRRKDVFLATLAHELRNPLAPIRNGLEILKRNPSQDMADKVTDMMDRQLSHMVHLIDDLLDMSRISQGKIELRREIFDIRKAVDIALESCQPSFVQKFHNVEVDVASGRIWVHADLTRLGQIISNLLNNAAKYTPEHGEIRLHAFAENGDAVIEISDNGIGIPKNMLGKIFELFTQVQNSLGHSQGGLGIGLALVRHLVEMHGGTIAAESDGKGSTFIIRMPLADLPGKSLASSRETANLTRSVHILIVDDNVDSARTTGWMLESSGHTHTLAHDGPGAIETAKKCKPDAIFLDIGLPGMTGYDVCKNLRQMPEFKNTLIVAQTGWGQKRDRDAAIESGFDQLLVKPLKLSDIKDLLNHHFSRADK